VGKKDVKKRSLAKWRRIWNLPRPFDFAQSKLCVWGYVVRGTVGRKQDTLAAVTARVEIGKARPQPRTTLAAWKPLGPFSRSNSTVSPSLRVR
jgi:hypothetical protein